MTDERAITEFWAWWPDLVSRLEANDAVVRLEDDADLGERASAIHPKIQVLGEYRPDGSSWLCLSSRGNIELRPLVQLWAARAQLHSDGWRFLTARPRSWPPTRHTPFPFVELELVHRHDELREVIHVSLYHPAMATMEPVQTNQLAFMALDHLLGEDDVERWIGNLSVATERPEGAAPIESLCEAVRAAAERATAEQWQAVSSGPKSAPTLVTINRAVKPIDHVELGMHVRIDMQLRAPGPRGLAQGKEELALNRLQAALSHDLGARAVVVARETHLGHRIIHLHAEPRVARDVTTWRQRHPDWEISVLSQADPGWEILRRWDAVNEPQ